MTRRPGDQNTTFVQVLNSSGDKATEAVVNYKIYWFNPSSELWEVYESGLMNHVGDGIYGVSWESDNDVEGDYVFYAYSSNPKFHDSQIYHIEFDDSKSFKFRFPSRNTISSFTNDTYETIWEYYGSNAPWAGFLLLRTFGIWLHSTGAAPVNVKFRVTIDNGGGSPTGESESWEELKTDYSNYYLYLYRRVGFFYIKSYTEERPVMFGFCGKLSGDSDSVIHPSYPLHCQGIKIEMKIETVPAGMMVEVDCDFSEGQPLPDYED
jgi:hypothetical protein